MAANFTASALVRYLHGIPHYDSGFRTVPADFDPQSTTYWESLGMFAVPFGVAGVLFALIYAVTVGCCRRRLCAPRPGSSVRCSLVFFGLTLLPALAATVGVFFYNQHLNEGVGHVHDSLADFAARYDDILSDGAAVSADAAATMATAVDFEDAYKTKMGPEMVKNMEALRRYAGEIGEEVTSVLGEFNETSSAVDELSRTLPHVKTYNRYRSAATLVFAALLLSGLMCGAGGMFGKSRSLVLAGVCVGVTFVAVLCVLAGIEFGASVGVADVCVDPDHIVRTQAAGHVSEDVLEYYLVCAGVPSPFAATFAAAQKALAQAMVALTSVATEAEKPGVDPELAAAVKGTFVPEMRGNLTALAHAMDAVRGASDCDAPHADYRSVEEGLCVRTVESLVALVFLMCIASLAVALGALVAPMVWARFAVENEYEHVSSFLDTKDRTFIMEDGRQPCLGDDPGGHYEETSSFFSRGGDPERMPLMSEGKL